jgi:hypothetical protein
MAESRLDLPRTTKIAETLCILDGVLLLELFLIMQSENHRWDPFGLLVVLLVMAGVLNIGFLFMFELTCRKASAARDAHAVAAISRISEKIVILDLWIRMGALRLAVFAATVATNLLVAILLYQRFLS